MPFNTETLFGFTAYSLILVFGFILILHNVFLALGILTGYFGTVIPISTHIQRKLHNFNENYKIDKNDKEWLNGLLDTIRFTSESKELSIVINDRPPIEKKKQNFEEKNLFLEFPLNLWMYSNLLSPFFIFGACWPFVIPS